MKKSSENSQALLKIAEVATRLNASEKTVRRLIEDGSLPVIRCGRLLRVHPDDLDRFVAAHRFVHPPRDLASPQVSTKVPEKTH